MARRRSWRTSVDRCRNARERAVTSQRSRTSAPTTRPEGIQASGNLCRCDQGWLDPPSLRRSADSHPRKRRRGRGVRTDAIALRRHRDLGAAATSVPQATSLPWPLLGQRTGCLTRGRAARRHKPIPQRETVRNGSSSELANVGRPLSQCARCERLS